jgi:hypothetical protein
LLPLATCKWHWGREHQGFFCSSELFWSPVVRLMCDACLLDFYIFNFFFRTAGPILTKLGTNHP